MMQLISHIIPAMVTSAMIVGGHILYRISIKSIKERIDFIVAYNNHFVVVAENYLKKGYADSSENYDFCISNVDRIQAELGRDGIVYMSDNLRGVRIRSYALFSNIFVEMRQSSGLMFTSLMRERMASLFGTCTDALRKHIGNLDHETDFLMKKLYNPFSCFSKTIQWILDLPIRILVSFGIINSNKRSEISNNIIYKLIGLAINIISFVSAIMTIILGWDDFLELIIRIF